MLYCPYVRYMQHVVYALRRTVAVCASIPFPTCQAATIPATRQPWYHEPSLSTLPHLKSSQVQSKGSDLDRLFDRMP
jgi:hypothetical protein